MLDQIEQAWELLVNSAFRCDLIYNKDFQQLLQRNWPGRLAKVNYCGSSKEAEMRTV
jgi:hypothetical protein